MFCTYLYIIHEPIHFPRPKHSEHGLTNVERVPPVVITDGSVVFLDAQHPAAQGLKIEDKTRENSRKQKCSLSEAIWTH